MKADELRALAARHARPEGKQATPPVEEGVVLAEFDRDGGVLRLAVNTYEGHPFVQLRVWTRDATGGLWPSKAGVTVRRRELPEFAAAVANALDLVAQYDPQPRAPEAPASR